MSDHPLIRRLIELDLPRGDWALFGSGPLLMRGWIDAVGDLDIVCRGAAWDRAREVGEVGVLAAERTELQRALGDLSRGCAFCVPHAGWQRHPDERRLFETA